LGQSVWLDYIRRSFIDDGGLQTLVDQGIRGVTSNPTIFEKAIAGSSDYDAQLKPLAEAGKSVLEIYEALAMEDIRRAAAVLRPVYDSSDGADGFVSLEVSPTLAHDTDGTIADARRFFATLDLPNVMIKVPATPAGIPAIETLIGDGININVTLIFSVAQYEAVVNAYIAGLEKLAAAGGDVSRVNSVASFFVSRVDGVVDDLLTKQGNSDLLGKIAVANAKIAYDHFQQWFSGERWEKLAALGAKVQRPLWASTSSKNPNYPDTLYVDTLIGPHTVNTMPTNTIDATLDHGTVACTIDVDIEQARAQLARLADLGIDFARITQDLQDDGVDKFAKSFESLMDSIAQKQAKLLASAGGLQTALGTYRAAVDSAVAEAEANRIVARIWEGDHTVWKDDPTEISNRLGWLRVAEAMQAELPELHRFVEAVRADGYTHALLLGMGGSSLAPEVFRKTFGVRDGYLDLAVLDSTDPGAVLAYERQLDLTKTLFIVSTKSGGTVETASFFKYFYNRVAEAVGEAGAGAHFIAITDPGSSLKDLAEQYRFRAVFLNDPNIGGRYSALSHFGLVPAALLGVDLQTLLDRAVAAAGSDQGVRLGVIMGELAKAGRDKITFVTSLAIESFGDWVEQLIAESTGKDGTGILPVVGETLGSAAVYKADRLFVQLRLGNDETHTAAIQSLEDAGHPAVGLHLADLYDLGGQFFLWEMATAIAGYRLGIQPFDQPNVESAKVQARKMLAAYQQEGKLPELTPAQSHDGITVYGDVSAGSPAEALLAFLAQGGDHAYIALHAYIQPTAAADAALQTLRHQLRAHTGYATTVGFGPRFLHSTGQLHKGDGGNGLFIQFTAASAEDAAIPDEAGKPESSIGFGTLKMAQALGDRQALLDNGRRVIRFDLGDDVAGSLARLTAALG
jgi:transaldolase/glucose-6-phosphate isomerase